MKSFILKLFIYLFATVYLSNVYGQALERNKTIAVYIYNFAKHITWQNENQLEKFNIVLISDDVSLKIDFETIFKSTKIKNLPIKIELINNPDKVSDDVQIVFISETMNTLYYDLFDKVKNKNILIVSENYTDKKYAMINLYDSSDRKLKFEINRHNTDNQSLLVDDEILLQGGTLIDVQKLYKNSQSTLIDIEQKLKENQKKLDSINKIHINLQHEISNQENLIKDQQSLIETKKKLIKIHKSELLQQQNKTKKQNTLIEKQNAILINQQNIKNEQAKKLRKIKDSLEKKELKIQNINDALAYKQNKIIEMNSIISDKSQELGEKTAIIDKQKQVLYLFLIIIILIIAGTLITYNLLRKNKKKNKQLNENQIKIEEINQELQASIEEIQSTNDELHSKNEELITTLAQLKEAQESLLQSEKMASLGVLTAGIAHEMNNPINFIYAGVNCLKKDFADIIPILNEIEKIDIKDENLLNKLKLISKLKEQNEYSYALTAITQTISDIELGATRTSEIVKGLRNFSRIDKAEWLISDIHEILNDTLVILKSKYKMSIQIIKNYDLNLPSIECLPGKLNQVFVNIISNAIDAIEDKGKIEITTSSEVEKVIIKIKNNGKEISPEVLAKIFDPFFTTKKVGKGQGLGLSITYGIIKEHKGNISVKSDKEKGTEFTIKLPIIQQKQSV